MNLPIDHIKFSPNNNLFCISSGARVNIYEKPSSNIKGFMLEPFMLVRRFNTESVKSLNTIAFSEDSRFLLYASDDNVVRTAGLLGGTFPRFKLKGHKSKVLQIIPFFKYNNTLVSIDNAGLILFWELTKLEEGEERGFKSLKGNKINQEIDEQDMTQLTNLSELESKIINSRFILKTKKLLFQEKTEIDFLSFSKDKEHFTVAFKNKSFGVYRLNIFSEELITCIITFKKEETLGNVISLQMHPSRPIIAFGDSKESLVLWDWKAKSYILKQKALGEQISATAFSQDKKLLAIGDCLGQIKLFNFKSKLNIVTFQDCMAKVTGIR